MCPEHVDYDFMQFTLTVNNIFQNPPDALLYLDVEPPPFYDLGLAPKRDLYKNKINKPHNRIDKIQTPNHQAN